MKKILILFTIFIFSCDEPEVDCEGVEGGTAIEDCQGVCNGNAEIDCEGICGGGSEIDCEGVCGGQSILDMCNVCNGDGSSCLINCADGYSPIPNARALGGVTSGDYLGNSCYYNDDIAVLEDFISNSSSTINSGLDLNDNDIVEWFELGEQVWKNGRINAFYDWYSREYPYTWGNYNSDVIYSSSQLSGSIPISISNWDAIEILYLINKSDKDDNPDNDAALIGSIDMLENLSSLIHLGVINHSLSGEIPNNIYTLSNLETLYLGQNNFSGGISSNISNLINLRWFWVGENNLSGELPIELWSISSLREITVEHNNFTGSIPNFSQNQLPNLYWLNLNDNNFHSTIPVSICSLNALMNILGDQTDSGLYYYFDISNNKFCPEYPSCIASYIGDQDTGECLGRMSANSINLMSKNISLNKTLEFSPPRK